MRRELLCLAATAALSACAVPVLAQAELSGPDRFPQFRGLSGLSGGGYGVDQDGRASFRGAMAYSTPIGHTLGRWSIAAGTGLVSIDRKYRFGSFKDSGTRDGNGTGFATVGLDLEQAGSLAFGFTLLSGVGDNVSNIQYSPRLTGPIKCSVGVQDLGGSGGSAGEGRPGDTDSSRSIYGAVTWQIKDGIYLTGGAGTRRFQKGFGSLSAGLGRNFRGLVEHDGWNFNYGIAYNPGPLYKVDSWDAGKVRTAEITVFAGIIQNRYAGWSVAVSF